MRSSSAGTCQHFRIIYCLCHQTSTLKAEATRFCEMFVPVRLHSASQRTITFTFTTMRMSNHRGHTVCHKNTTLSRHSITFILQGTLTSKILTVSDTQKLNTKLKKLYIIPVNDNKIQKPQNKDISRTLRQGSTNTVPYIT